MDLNLKFKQIWEQLNIGQQAVLVGVSGGVDSMVLLDLLGQLPYSIRPVIHVATVDHCLRPESVQETEYVRQYCLDHGLNFHTIQWPKNTHPSAGIEEAGRHFRYRFFADIMTSFGIKHLLTAHHADDQAETFLMKLIRGGDLSQLKGIQFQRSFMSDRYLSRPLLSFAKKSLYAYANQRQLTFFEDQTNSSDEFLRNRIRHEVVPLLKQESPHFLEHLNSYQQQLNELFSVSKRSLSKLITDISTPEGYRTEKWLMWPVAEKKATLRLICEQQVGEINEGQVNEMIELLENERRPQGKIDVKGQKVFYKNYHLFGVKTVAQPDEIGTFKQRLTLGQWVDLSPNEKIGLFPAGTLTAENDDVLEITAEFLPLDVRHRLFGDKLCTSIGKQKVKKILIDRKVPVDQRAKVWVVCNENNEVLWIVGHKKSNLSRQDVNDKIHYIVIYRKISGEKR